MSVYTNRKNFFKERSEQHYLVKHNHVIPDSGGMKRKSFIVIDNPEELAAATINQGHFPMVVHNGFEGKPLDKNGSLRIRNVNELIFLDKPLTSADNVTKSSANDAAYNRSFEVMMDFIAWMYEQYEETGSCGPFKELDINQFNWRIQDYISDGFVGWVLTFSDEVKATDIIVFDEDKWIVPEP
jgi:hypothetical protein